MIRAARFARLSRPLCFAQALVVSTGHHLAGSDEKRRDASARIRRAAA